MAQFEYLLLFFPVMLISFVSAQVNDKVKFNVISSRSIEEPPSIEVTLNGLKGGLELTHYRMNDESAVGCNYLGYLRNTPSSSVAVTGCLNKPGDRMEVTIISEGNINQMFTVDFNGNAEIIKSPFEEGALSRAIKVPKISLADRDFDDNQGDEIFDDSEEEQVAAAKMSSIPSKLKAVIKFGYEDGLNSELPEDFDSWIAGVFTHTQAHFRHAASLGTTIEFEVQGSAVYQQGSTWTADYNLWDANAATNSLGLSGVDVMSWWCKRNDGGEYAGMAYIGTLCTSRNTNLNEKQRNTASSGFLLAHELGHNFGMSHDFDDKHGGHDGPCNGKGIMSYGSYRYDQWSTCSRNDWEAHYSGLNWGQGCLEDISGCQDSGSYNHQECQTWKGWNLCGSAKWGTFMKDHCKKSCGLCDNAGCFNIDGDTICEQWKSAGYCTQTYVDYMKENCKKTCGYCV